MENHISTNLQVTNDPVSLGDLCQAMFIEGARVLATPRRRSYRRKFQEQILLAAVMIGDGLEWLLQSQYGTEQESTM